MGKDMINKISKLDTKVDYALQNDTPPHFLTIVSTRHQKLCSIQYITLLHTNILACQTFMDVGRGYETLDSQEHEWAYFLSVPYAPKFHRTNTYRPRQKLDKQ